MLLRLIFFEIRVTYNGIDNLYLFAKFDLM